MSHRVCGGQKTTLGVCPRFPPGLETGSLLCGFSTAHSRLFDLPVSSDAPVSTSPLTVSSGIIDELYHTQLYIVSEASNSGPPTCTTSIFTYSSESLFWVKVSCGNDGWL